MSELHTEGKSGSDNNMEGGGSGDDQEPAEGSTQQKKPRYHRHSAFQIQQMESFFKECPHPDEKQRQELGRALKLSPRQVKFWFQNRRTQMKAQHERSENSQLRSENERLRIENITMREAIKHASCPSCGSLSGDLAAVDEHQLRIDNVRLREELQRVSSVAARYFGRPVPTLGLVPPAPALLTTPPPLDLAGSSGGAATLGLLNPVVTDILPGPTVAEVALRPGALTESEKPIVVELAMAALEEFLRMIHSDEPLWMKGGADGSTDILNTDEYYRQFPGGLGPRPFALKSEASRDGGLVIMNGATLVEALMDAEKWMEMFPSIVAKAVTVEVLSPGIGMSPDGALQLMYAELQVLSPLVQTREVYFVRYCKQAVDKVWAVVDVSVDTLRDNPPPSLLRCRRRPSGCLVQDMPNGYSQVTWLEHVEVEEQQSVHPLFRSLANTGLAFGARRWRATLQRHCESLVSLLASNISPRDLGVIQTPEGRRAMLRLAHKMTRRFCSTISASTSNTWLNLSSGNDDVRIMMRENPGDGLLLCAATSTWLPFSRIHVFEFLRHERSRGEWDVLANGAMEKMYHIAEGQHPGNNVSLLRPSGSNPNQGNVIFLQESCTDASGSLIVYAPVDFSTLNMVLQGEDPSRVMPPPSGFVILPDGPENSPSGLLLNELDSQSVGGSILTVSIQIAVTHVPSLGKLNIESVNTISNIIINTVQKIKSALQCMATTGS
ncbi:hypothetical protein KP509_12G070600 [Ceratopteris richardii]|nr:hypothetical protein KP509_12G070600 [Ceratopteris richardii]KAH7423728.1 hypothetical protein KP509_12G070600 [Ceratopteris richardii]